MLPDKVGSFPVGLVKQLVSLTRFEELVQYAYDHFDSLYHGWQDDLADEFDKWKLQNSVGQGLVEYALILVLVTIVVLVITSLLGPAVGNVF